MLAWLLNTCLLLQSRMTFCISHCQLRALSSLQVWLGGWGTVHAGNDAIIPQWVLCLLMQKLGNPVFLLRGKWAHLLMILHPTCYFLSTMMKVAVLFGTDETTASFSFSLLLNFTNITFGMLFFCSALFNYTNIVPKLFWFSLVWAVCIYELKRWIIVDSNGGRLFS